MERCCRKEIVRFAIDASIYAQNKAVPYTCIKSQKNNTKGWKEEFDLRMGTKQKLRRA